MDIDVYDQWLGIGPAEQPPHHYRLLGVDLFEERKDAINAAALQRSARVRQYQTGPLGELAARLLTEIATAQACLLDPVRRAKYDAELVARLSPVAAAPPAPMPAAIVSPMPVAAPPPLPVATPAAPVFDSVAKRYAEARRKRINPRWLMGLLIAAVIFAVALLLIRSP